MASYKLQVAVGNGDLLLATCYLFRNKKLLLRCILFAKEQGLNKLRKKFNFSEEVELLRLLVTQEVELLRLLVTQEVELLRRS